MDSKQWSYEPFRGYNIQYLIVDSIINAFSSSDHSIQKGEFQL